MPATPTPISTALLPLSAPPDSWEALAEWVISARSGGYEVAVVQAALQVASWQQVVDDFQAFDLDGDGVNEWLLTLYQTGLPGYEPGSINILGRFWVVNNAGIVYTIDRTDDGVEDAPTIVTIADFTGDGVYEVVTAGDSCGAHTCFQSYRIISTHNGSWQNIVDPLEHTGSENPDQAIFISYSTASTADFTGDGVYDLQIAGGTSGSAGAGVNRGYTAVWAWDGAYLTRASFAWDRTDFRHHRLYDALDADEDGDYQLAYDLYTSVIEDDLEDIESFAEGDSYDSARIFAAFRLIRLALEQADVLEAVNWVGWLEFVYPGVVLEDAGNILVQTYQETNDLNQACQAVADFITPFGNVVGAISDMGYANPTLSNDTVCPVE
ncbi:MAG: hypothetical protein KAG66_21800, partial [Methylococcales bacterium]|nr:hypothetical protein [Methylococcales bacterium]